MATRSHFYVVRSSHPRWLEGKVALGGGGVRDVSTHTFPFIHAPDKTNQQRRMSKIWSSVFRVRLDQLIAFGASGKYLHRRASLIRLAPSARASIFELNPQRRDGVCENWICVIPWADLVFLYSNNEKSELCHSICCLTEKIDCAWHIQMWYYCLFLNIVNCEIITYARTMDIFLYNSGWNISLFIGPRNLNFFMK